MRSALRGGSNLRLNPGKDNGCTGQGSWRVSLGAQRLVSQRRRCAGRGCPGLSASTGGSSAAAATVTALPSGSGAVPTCSFPIYPNL
ncbi:hypothetical protein GCM10018790_63170 [Kitasatospora xanthocidica]|nr:hypothetical protein GCM10018790_63170 [Kitasatospora xanthocidica]